MNNKSIKNKMIERFGEECMMEQAEIRYIPQALRETMPDYREAEDRIEYHHVVPVRENGATTIANGVKIF